MRRTGSYLAGALSLPLAMLACTGRNATGTDGQSPAVPQVVAAQDPATSQTAPTGVAACTNGVTVRLVGVNPAGISERLVLQMASLFGSFVGPNGQAIFVPATNPATWPLDVSSDAVTHDLGTLAIPPDAAVGGGIIQVTFSSGTASLFNASGSLDLCTFPLVVALQPWRLQKMSCLVEIALDAGRSLAMAPDGIAFEPHYRVLFQEKP